MQKITTFSLTILAIISLGVSISNDPNQIGFYLYKNPLDLDDADFLIYENVSSVSSSRYDSSLPVILMTHGFAQNRLSQFPYYVKRGYLGAGYAAKANLIVVDWGELSGQPDPNSILPELIAQIPDYVYARNNVPIVAKRVQEFLSFLIDEGFLSGPDQIHLVGQSLGAHVSGITGMNFKQITSTQIARITGTDPAGPLFQGIPIDERLDATDADFVDIIHVNEGEFGYVGSIGDVDFVVNGGIFQLSCLTNLTDLFCSHNLAARYFAQSISKDSIKACSDHSCLTQVTFGEHCPPTTPPGTYYLDLELELAA